MSPRSSQSQPTSEWPTPDWQVADSPEMVGMSSSAIDDYLNWLSSKAAGEPVGAIIIRNGKVACEFYAGGATASSKWEIGSLRKAIGSAILGIAVEQGKLAATETGPDAACPLHCLERNAWEIWPDIYEQTGNEKDKQIKIAQLFSATSGWKRPEAPGTRWVYSNSAFTASGAVLGRAYNQPSDRIADLAKTMIADPIGASQWDCYHYEDDFSDDFSEPGPKLAVDSNMRDLAKFGYLWLMRGNCGGVQIIPESYVTAATTNRVAQLGKHYGYCWFVNDGRVLLPDAPDDAFFHVGNGRADRRTVLIVIPSLDIVAAVGTHASAYNITDGYLDEPVGHVNEWCGKIVAAVRS